MPKGLLLISVTILNEIPSNTHGRTDSKGLLHVLILEPNSRPESPPNCRPKVYHYLVKQVVINCTLNQCCIDCLISAKRSFY